MNRKYGVAVPSWYRWRVSSPQSERAEQRKEFRQGESNDLYAEMKRLAAIALSPNHSPHAKERARSELEEIFRRYRVRHLNGPEAVKVVEYIRTTQFPQMSPNVFGAAVQMALDPQAFVKEVLLTSEETLKEEDVQKILATILL